MNVRDHNITIGSVVAELPKASRIFGGYGIDFCCGGHKNLRAVIKEQGIAEEAIYSDLEEVQREREESYKDISFNTMSPTVLSAYIEDRHHNYLRETLPEIAQLLATILRVHGNKHTELFEVYRLYGMLKSDLEQHLLREETMLFPAFEEEMANEKAIAEQSAIIIAEHEAAGEVLEKLRHATKHYQIPQDVCGTFRKTYELLEELEMDLHEHIHLENNILLKNYDTRAGK